MYEDVPTGGYFWQHLSNIQRTGSIDGLSLCKWDQVAENM